MELKINIVKKHPTIEGAPVIVCGNSGYTVRFTFDAEWDGLEVKTARFVYVQNGTVRYQDIVFSGDTATVPVMSNTKVVLIGVYAGNLRTSAPARVPCVKSIRCGTGAPADPTPSQYDQIMELLNAGGGVSGEGTPYAVQYVSQALTEEQQARARANIGAVSPEEINSEVTAGLEAAKKSGQFDGPAGPAGPKGNTGAAGTSVTVSSVTESDESGGENVVKFSDGKTLIVKNGKDGVSDVSIPSYWETAVLNAIAKVKAIQNNGGKDVVNFIHFSDMHYNSGRVNYTNNIGAISARLMAELNIPFLVGTGDITESGTASASAIIDADVDEAIATLKPVGLENLIYCKGNHDGAWGAKADYGVNYAMIQHPKKLWNRLYRWQAKDFRRVFSEDGSYYFVDNIPQKVRYIVLNSHWADYSSIDALDYDAQSTEYNTQKNINYGDAQAEWLATKALNFEGEEGWTVAVFTHAPLWNKYNGVARNYMAVQYAGTNNASTIRSILIGFYSKSASVTYKSGATVDYSGIGDNTIAGVFCGHCHTDIMCKRDEAGNGTDIPFPIVSVTSAGNVNSSYEEGFGMAVTTRTQNSDTETAFDIVSIDKSTKMIYTTRIGAGNDRNTFYGSHSVDDVVLTSISATYTGGNVEVGTALNALTGITVIAHYSDGSTAAVTDYTLSGGISNVGNNTITVSYSGMTTSFVVVGIEAESGIPDVVLNTNVFDKTADGFLDNTRISSSAASNGYLATASSNNQFVTNYIRIDKGMYLNVDVPGSTTQASTTVGGYMLSYDENKNLIGTYTSLSGSVSSNKYKYQVNVNGVVYVRLAPYKTTGSGITTDNCKIVVTTS